MHSAEHRAFLAAAASWNVSGDERHAARMLRSPFSGVPYDLAAAYAALSKREGSILNLIARGRIAAPADDRDTLLAFSDSLRSRSIEPSAVPSEEAPAFEAPAEFALCEPVEEETAAPVRAHTSRFSASQLNTYAECERKWYYRYLCASVEDKGSSASYYGTAFHAALEDFHGDFPDPGNFDPHEMDRRLQGYVNSAFDRFRDKFETPVEHELQVRRARRTARKYVQWLLAEWRRAPFTIVGCEVPISMQIEGFDFVGYIDRVDRDEQTAALSVVDYKTGTIATSAAEYREKVRTFRDFQLPFYYWARTEAGDRVWKLALVPLKDALLDVRPIVLEVVPVSAEIARSASSNGVIPITELERARTRMVEICREIGAENRAQFAVTTDPAACTFCSYQIACLRKPYPEEERFGR